MKLFAPLIVAFSLLALAPATSAAPDIKVTELRGPLHLLQGRGGNVVASIGADGVLLIDDDYAPLAPAYQRAIDELSGSTDAPRFVLNTHWHGDHTGGNLHWAAEGSIIVAQSNVRQRMSRPSKHPFSGEDRPPSPASALPVVSYSQSMALHFNQDDVELQHFPGGHTDGDAWSFSVRRTSFTWAISSSTTRFRLWTPVLVAVSPATLPTWRRWCRRWMTRP